MRWRAQTPGVLAPRFFMLLIAVSPVALSWFPAQAHKCGPEVFASNLRKWNPTTLAEIKEFLKRFPNHKNDVRSALGIQDQEIENRRDSILNLLRELYGLSGLRTEQQNQITQIKNMYETRYLQEFSIGQIVKAHYSDSLDTLSRRRLQDLALQLVFSKYADLLLVQKSFQAAGNPHMLAEIISTDLLDQYEHEMSARGYNMDESTWILDFLAGHR